MDTTMKMEIGWDEDAKLEGRRERLDRMVAAVVAWAPPSAFGTPWVVNAVNMAQEILDEIDRRIP